MIARFARARDIGYTLLSDAESALIRGFDVIDGSVPESAAWYGLARPAIFVIDPDGIITHRFADADYTVRPAPQDVLDALR